LDQTSKKPDADTLQSVLTFSISPLKTDIYEDSRRSYLLAVTLL